MEKTLSQFNAIFRQCKELFLLKFEDYGTAWRILRPTSLTDQLYIKASRIRSIQENKTQKVEDSVQGDFMGLVNYSIMALIQIAYPPDDDIDLEIGDLVKYYDEQCDKAIELLSAKNFDYSEAWRDMRISSITDLILMKLLRIKQIEDNQGKTLVSEGLSANYLDIINYAVFAQILILENQIITNTNNKI